MYVPPQCCKQQSLAGGDPTDFLMQCTTREDRPPGISGGPKNNALIYRVSLCGKTICRNTIICPSVKIR